MANPEMGPRKPEDEVPQQNQGSELDLSNERELEDFEDIMDQSREQVRIKTEDPEYNKRADEIEAACRERRRRLREVRDEILQSFGLSIEEWKGIIAEYESRKKLKEDDKYFEGDDKSEEAPEKRLDVFIANLDKKSEEIEKERNEKTEALLKDQIEKI